MGKHRGQFKNHNNGRQQQVLQNNAGRHHRHSPKIQVVVLLENGISFSGTAVVFSDPNRPKCKIFFKGENRRELEIAVDINIHSPGPEKIIVLQTTINNHLIALHEEAIMEFPAWLEKHSTRVNEDNPYFNLDEIREEFKFKQVRFGIWRIAAQIGFFDGMKPQFAKFNRVIHLELREPELGRPN
jgi:hypothetical protein